MIIVWMNIQTAPGFDSGHQDNREIFKIESQK